MTREEDISKACEEIYNKLVLDGTATPKEFGEACMKWADEHPSIVPTKVNAFDQIQFDVNAPGFLKEIVDNSQTRMYPVTFKLFAQLLNQVAERATELHDPVMDALMIRLNLYELPVNERRKTVAKLEQYMKEQSQQ